MIYILPTSPQYEKRNKKDNLDYVKQAAERQARLYCRNKSIKSTATLYVFSE